MVKRVMVWGEGVQVGYEGCLSYRGGVGEVDRHDDAFIKGRYRHGKEVRIKATGFTARAYQHELDHLDGVLFIDRLTSLDTLHKLEELEDEEDEVPAAVVQA